MSGDSADLVITAVEESGVSTTEGNQVKTNCAKKQARLPFKILDPQTAPLSGKKRKHSDDETMSKTTRTSASKLVDKKVTPVKGSNKVVIVDEHEVSSSSEPDNSQVEKKAARAGLMKFFSPAQLKEVSTSVPSESEADSEITSKGHDNDSPSTAKSRHSSVTMTTIAEESNEKAAPPEEELKEPECVSVSSQESKEADSKTGDEEELEITMSDDSVMDVSVEDADESLVESSNEDNLKRSLSETSLEKDSEDSKAQKTEEGDVTQAQKKPRKLSAKQLQLKQEREQQRAEKQKQKEMERLEKEKKKQEERDRKLAEKEKKEKEKLEKKEALEKEKLEKQKAKDEEKKKKLEAVEAEKVKKEEERKKKEEEKAKKEEEKSKKEEERKLKEEERLKKEEEKKKEEEQKLKKTANQKAAFMSFFKKSDKVEESPASKPVEKSTKFMAFMPQKGMVLAPARRTKLETFGFDESYNKQSTSCKLYLDELKMCVVKPRRCAKTLKTNDRDVILLDEDAPDFYKAKFLKFHENHRPAFYGTWRKRSKILSAKNPLKKDENLFDYEVDSDEEWEEEEPGESLSDSEGEEEEEPKEEADDDEEEDGFFVPHGYLSDDEGCEDDDDMTPEKMKAKQLAKQRAFEVQLKQQCHKLIPVMIGVCWQYTESLMETQLRDFECVSLLTTPLQTSLSEVKTAPVEDSKDSSKDDKKNRKLCVPEEAMADLIRLVHGNVNAIKKLMIEFRSYWRQHCNPEKETDESLDKSVTEKSETEVEEPKSQPCTPKAATSSPSVLGNALGGISKRQLEMKIQSIADYKKGDYIRKCWYVKDEILKQYGLEGLAVPTEWTYVTNVNKDTGRNTPIAGRNTPKEGRDTPTGTGKGANKIGIKQFAVKTTSDDLFTSPSAIASPKQVSNASMASPKPLTPTSAKAPLEKTSPLVNKPARRVQLTTLGAFMSKSSALNSGPNAGASPNAVSKPPVGAAPVASSSSSSEVKPETADVHGKSKDDAICLD